MRCKIILFIVMILISSVYAEELEPGKLWINGVFIPYEKEKITCKLGQIIGDINNDREINQNDVDLLSDIVAFKISPPEDICCADLTRDGNLDLSDALYLQYILIAKKQSPGKCGEIIYNASISIATLKDSYNVGEKIELTDPPDEVSFEENKITGNAVKENVNLGQDIIHERLGTNVEEKLKKEIEEGIISETIDTSLLPKYVKGELIVKLKKDVSNKITGSAIKTDIGSIDELNQKYDVEKIENVFKVKKEGFFESIGNTAKELVGVEVPKRELKKIYKLDIPEKLDVEEIAEEYKKDPKVEFAEPNYISYTSFVPNDARYTEQWAHQNTQADLGWDIQKGNSNVVIAIVDTGVDYTHEDLVANIWQNSDEIPGNGIDDDNNGYIDDIRGYDFVNTNLVSYCKDHPDECQTLEGEDYDTRDNDPIDFNSHGTHCAGIAAGVGNNNIGITGVCPDCKIMSIRAGYSIKINYNGNWIETGSLSYDAISNAIKYAADNGAKVISMSFGGDNSNVMKEAIDYAYSKGVVLIAAAGNSNSNSKSYPAGYDNVIAIAATSQTDEKADYSNYGYWVDVAAPGGDYNKDTMILSTVPSYIIYNSEVNIKGTIISSDTLEYSATTPSEGINGELIYVGLGKLEDLQGKNLNGKIALIQRGEISFKDKVNNIKKAGAIGAIIFNNEDRIFKGSLQEKSTIPVVSISKADGDNLVNQVSNGIVTVNIKVSSRLEKYASYQGTSMACPYVAGLAGLLFSKNIKYSQEEIKQILTNAVDPVSSNGYIGTGRVNVKKALEFEPIKVVAEIKSPKNDDIISDNINIVGTADGDNYKVYYGKGIYPKEWIEIGSGTKVNNDILASWNIDNIDEAYYTIKLEVIKNNNKIEDFVRVTIAKGFQEGFPFDAGDGYIVSYVTADLDNDGTLEIIFIHGESVNPEIYALRSDGTILWQVRFSNEIDEIQNIRTVPSIADINNDGYLEIFFSAAKEDIDGKIKDALYALDHDGNVLDGWPKMIERESHDNWWNSIIPSLVIADVNNDNNSEIIFPSRWDGLIYILDKDGNLISRIQLPNKQEIQYNYPAVGNIDDDPELEIVMKEQTNNSQILLYAFNPDGSLINNFPVSLGEAYYAHKAASPILFDINKDNKNEIIIGNNVNLYVLNGNGKDVSGFPRNVEQDIKLQNYISMDMSSAALGDVDGDGELEIVIASDGYTLLDYRWIGSISAYNLDNSLVEGFPIIILDDWFTPNTPVIGDINGDNKEEIIISSGCSQVNKESNLYIIGYVDGNLQIIPGFPKKYNTNIGTCGIIQTPVIADLDNDNHIELIIGTDGNLGRKIDGTLFVFDLQENKGIISWPMIMHDERHTGLYERPKSQFKWVKRIEGLTGLGGGTTIFNSPTISDIDNDGTIETFIATSGNNNIKVNVNSFGYEGGGELFTYNTDEANSIQGNIYAFDSDGNSLDGFPIKVPQATNFGVVIDDVNNDGKKELIVPTSASNGELGKLYVLDTRGKILDEFSSKTSNREITIFASTVISDIDDDGVKEIISTAYHRDPNDPFNWATFGSTIVVLNFIDGVLTKKFEFDLNNVVGVEYIFNPIVVDINGDNKKEIIFGAMKPDLTGEMYIIDHQGNLIWKGKINDKFSLFIFGRAAVYDFDFDNDGKEEIVASLSEGKFTSPTSGGIGIIKFDENQQKPILIEGWPQLSDERIMNVILSDVDDDKEPEIIASEFSDPSNTFVRILEKDGTIKNSIGPFDKVTLGAVTDLNSDGQADIIFYSKIGNKNYIDAYDYDGNIIEGFPLIQKGEEMYYNSPAIGDFDNDGKLDVLSFSSAVVNEELYNELYLFSTDKNIAPIEWEQFMHDPQHTGNYHFGKEPLKLRPQSKIVNNEDFDLKGEIRFKVIRINEDGTIDDRGNLYSENIVVPAKGLIKLDKIFNSLNYGIGKVGKYKIIVELVDKNGNIIKTKSGELRAEWSFVVK